MYNLVFVLVAVATAQATSMVNEMCLIDIADQIVHQIRVSKFSREQAQEVGFLSDWMAQLDDGMLVSELSIPGTHDSGAFRCDYWMPCHIFQCQAMSILQQLQKGIRYLDLRINSAQPLTIGHQAIQFLSFQEAVKDISSFLKENPSEFIVIAFQRNSGQYDSSCQIMKQLANNNITTIYKTSTDVLTVGELRGKVWIFSGLGIDFNMHTFRLEGVAGVTDNHFIYLQNYWEIYPETVAFKTKSALETALTIDCRSNRIKANFLSGSVGVHPFDLAIDPKGPNNQLEHTLKHSQHKRCLGITILDYPRLSLIQQIIRSNILTK